MTRYRANVSADSRFANGVAGFVERIPQLEEKAQQIARRAVSHRNYLVGTAGLGILANGKLVEGAAHNYKPRKNGRTVCGEPQTAAQVIRARSVDMAGFVVVAQPQPDGETGINFGTLIVCGPCRRYMAKLAIIRPEVLFVTAHLRERDDPTRNFQIHSLGEIEQVVEGSREPAPLYSDMNFDYLKENAANFRPSMTDLQIPNESLAALARHTLTQRVA